MAEKKEFKPRTIVNRYYISNYSQYYPAKRHIAVKYLLLIFVCCAFFIIAIGYSFKSNLLYLPDDSTNYNINYDDVGIVLDQTTESYLESIDVFYVNDYSNELIDNPVFDRFRFILNDFAEFGNADNWYITLFIGIDEFSQGMNQVFSVLLIPFKLIINVIKLVLNVFKHLLGFDISQNNDYQWGWWLDPNVR